MDKLQTMRLAIRSLIAAVPGAKRRKLNTEISVLLAEYGMSDNFLLDLRGSHWAEKRKTASYKVESVSTGGSNLYFLEELSRFTGLKTEDILRKISHKTPKINMHINGDLFVISGPIYLKNDLSETINDLKKS